MAITYKEIKPGKYLEQYVQCYYIYECDSDTPFIDKAFATGCIEIMFNLGNGKWQTEVDGLFITTPSVELWGQIIKPLTFKSLGKNSMLGIRFFPHTASCFFNESLSLLNDRVSNVEDILNKSVSALHVCLMEVTILNKRIELIENFLLQRLSMNGKQQSRIRLIGQILNELKKEDFFDTIENVASRYGISSRYLQKLFLQHTGLTPKLFSKIHRFRNSLMLISRQNDSLTSIAYQSGFSDQSHFIREFKSFTGTTPSGFTPENSSALLISSSH